MYLKRIEIQGFKSFADPVSIDFREGVTCIIGPNGSGKSNISDAMRWALGEQSAKTLRGGRMEEIIFAGTESRRPKGMAEVTLVLDNSTGFLPIDYTEVAIKRRLFRSGESEYFLNNTQCRLRDVRELIMDTGIGVDGYSFIGQGRVDKIVSDRPETRREVFEEAAGIIKYKGRKAEAQRKLEAATDNLDRMNDIILDIESRIDGLKTESEKAKEYADLSVRYRELEINITLRNIENLQSKNRELQAQRDEAAAGVEETRERRLALERGLTALRKQTEEMEPVGIALRERIAENAARAAEIRNEALLNEEKRRSIERDRRRLEEDAAELKRRIAAEEERLTGLSAAKTLSDAKLADLEDELRVKLKRASECAEAVRAAGETIEKKRAAVFELSRARSMKQAEAAGNAELMGNFDAAKLRLEEELASALAAQTETEREAESVASSVAGLDAAAAAAAARERTARTDHEDVTRRVGEERKAVERLGLEMEQLSSRKKTIEEMEHNYEGYNAGVKALMKRKLPGIDGVVAELMRVPAGYETAVETALGAALQNIICADDESAKRGIEYLKEHKAGRLTFLPAASVRPKKRERPEAMERAAGFDGYAVERIAFDAKYAEIFAYLLGGVVFVDSLDNAIAMNRNNRDGFKLVTLEGEIVNPSGALTGGLYRNRTANLLARKSEIADLTERIARLRDERGRREKALAELAVRERALIEELRELDRESRAGDAESARRKSELKALRYRAEELAERIERRKRELRNIETDKEKNVGVNDELKADIARIGREIAVIEAETEEGLSQQRVRLEENEAAGEAVTEVRLRVAAAEAEKANNDANAETIARVVDELKAELRRKEAEYGALSQAGTPRGAVADAEAAAREMEEEKLRLEAELASMEAERRAKRREIEESERAMHALTDGLESRIASKNAMEVELGRQDTRLAAWKEKLFDEFELSYVHAMDFKKKDFVMGAALRENREIKERLRALGEVNPGAVRDYDETKERYDFLTEQRDDILRSMEDYRRIVTDMDKIGKARFKECFDAVVLNFDSAFKLLFGGGKGELRLEDENNPLESGIEIGIQPPGKANLVSIDGYSGGERAMIAIALMFAILKAKPTPFCILDEIDAALDETNIHRFADYITNFRETQFALVTHQRSTMEYADALFGVTMQEQGVTTILSLLLGAKETEDFAEKLDN
ncbi:MAG: chromosome segregation protein SMC [Clostridiales Family XIII bacterium]|jgi:chromosome segregation protein|nr:chromosome segregation protein SMC [Clostridiales Family XIII bacterium]